MQTKHEKVSFWRLNQGELFLYDSSVCLMKLPHIKGRNKGTFVEFNGVDLKTGALVYLKDENRMVERVHNLTITNNRRI